MQASKFRNDINGLRAWALVSVMLFHFSVPGFQGGFAGVDIFFVISGFLMTKIIMGRLDGGGFNLIGFYLDRARRIIPALWAMILVVGVIGWFILIPTGMLLFGKHAASALAFLSNILFWKESGYFDANARSKWLLHTWSLSVEWQFYILYPVFLLILKKIAPRKVLLSCVLAGTALSYAVSVWLGSHAPTAGFYLLPGRAWEMLAGGIVYLWPVPARLQAPRLKLAMELAGLALILCTVFLFADSISWPGASAAFPVLGTMLVIAAGRNDSVFTSNTLAGWLGRSSYSTYLWHWPIICALTYLGQGDSIVWRTFGFLSAFLVGWLSYRVVEQPCLKLFSGGETLRSKVLPLSGLAAAAFLLAGLGAVVWLQRGLPWRFSNEVAVADAAARDVNSFERACFGKASTDPASCVFGGDGRGVAVELVGDSHAEAVLSALMAAVPKTEAGGVLYRAFPSCPSILEARLLDPESKCTDFNRRYLKALMERPSGDAPLVIVNNWPGYLETRNMKFVPRDGRGGSEEKFSAALYEKYLKSTICEVAQRRRTYLVLPMPSFKVRVAETLAADLVRDPNAKDITIPEQQYRREQAESIGIVRRVASACHAEILDPAPLLCPGGVCMGSDRHRPIFKDKHHLTASGADRLRPMLASVFVPAKSAAN